MNQEPRSNQEGPVPPGVAKKLQERFAGKEVLSAKHLMDNHLNPLTGQLLKSEDLKPGQIVFWMNQFGLVGAVYRLVELHPLEPADSQMWVVEPLPISHAHNMETIKKIRTFIINQIFEDLQEDEEDLLARFEAGERIRCPARWQGKVAVALQDLRLAPDERDQMMDLLFESGE